MSEDDSRQYSRTVAASEPMISLNQARIMTASEVASTPSTRKCKRSRMRASYCSSEDSDDSNYRLILTRSIKKRESEQDDTELEFTTPKGKMRSVKETQSVGKIDRSADVRNKKGQKMEELCVVCMEVPGEERGSLPCKHQYCYPCISDWFSKGSSFCPCCKQQVSQMFKVTKGEQGVNKIEKIKVQKKHIVCETDYDLLICYVCGRGDDQHILLVCDDCDYHGCHVYCDDRLDNQMPEGDWYCKNCQERRQREQEQQQQQRQRAPRQRRQRGRARAQSRRPRRPAPRVNPPVQRAVQREQQSDRDYQEGQVEYEEEQQIVSLTSEEEETNQESHQAVGVVTRARSRSNQRPLPERSESREVVRVSARVMRRVRRSRRKANNRRS